MYMKHHYHWYLIKWRCLPLHLNFSSLSASILLLCILFGDSHFGPDVSIGFLWRYSASHFKLQSQINGFLPKCLTNNTFRYAFPVLLLLLRLTMFECFSANRNCHLQVIGYCCRKVIADWGCVGLWRYLCGRRKCRWRLKGWKRTIKHSLSYYFLLTYSSWSETSPWKIPAGRSLILFP